MSTTLIYPYLSDSIGFSKFSYISNGSYYCLPLGETASWTRLSEAQKAVIIAANNAYKQGKLGQKCN